MICNLQIIIISLIIIFPSLCPINCSKISVDIYFEREGITQQLRELLLHKFGKSSRLFSFPKLDISTFNSCIAILNQKLTSDEQPLDILLHTWSYLSGVRVLGLRNNSEYYYHNKHFLPGYTGDSEPVLIFSTENICAGVGEDYQDSDPNSSPVHEHHPVPSSLVSSCAFYRSNFGKSKLKHARERQTIIKEFLKDEARPLISPDNLADGEDATIGNFHLKAALECVLRLTSEEKPAYSLGIVKLFQNTAIYLSPEEGLSRLITGPCSIASISYLGLQDGIFIDRCESEGKAKNVIDYLLGLQFFRRSMYRSYEGTELEKTEYYPHYSYLGLIPEENLRELRLEVEREGGLRDFGRSFRNYIRDPSHENPESFSSIHTIIEALNEYQLKVPLLQDDELEVIWFEPEYSVDLSGDKMTKAFSNLISDDFIFAALRPTEGETQLPVSGLIKHLKCFSYQCIERIDLSKNCICDGGAYAIAEALVNNILPNLEELDLSYNRIGNEGLIAFEPLLRKDSFKHLVLYKNYIDIDGVRTIQPNRANQKVIWIPHEWLPNLLSEGKINRDEEKAHQRYYETL